jgi:hypothetical protein
VRKFGPFPLCLALFLVSIIMLGCGSNIPNGQLQSVTISPAAADAQDFPNGQVQFTATATYSDGTRLKPATALWTPGLPWSLNPQVPWPAIMLDSTGLASCGSAGPGTFVIYATAPLDPHFPLSKMTMTTPQMTGTAQLTCP